MKKRSKHRLLSLYRAITLASDASGVWMLLSDACWALCLLFSRLVGQGQPSCTLFTGRAVELGKRRLLDPRMSLLDELP